MTTSKGLEISVLMAEAAGLEGTASQNHVVQDRMLCFYKILKSKQTEMCQQLAILISSSRL